MKSIFLASVLILAGTAASFADDECSKGFGVCVTRCTGSAKEACETSCQQKSNVCYDGLYGKNHVDSAPVSKPVAAAKEPAADKTEQPPPK